MAVTIKDIAAAVGVSRGTVDRVINHRGGVSEEVAARVEQAVEEMGYFPNRAGRILAARKKPVTIGCLLPSDKITFFHDVIRGFFRAERELSDFGVSLRLKEVRGYDPEIHLAALRELLAENVSALCVATIETPEITALLNQTAAEGVPVAAINIDLPHVNRLFYIGSNYLAGGRTAGGPDGQGAGEPFCGGGLQQYSQPPSPDRGIRSGDEGEGNGLHSGGCPGDPG